MSTFWNQPRCKPEAQSRKGLKPQFFHTENKELIERVKEIKQLARAEELRGVGKTLIS